MAKYQMKTYFKQFGKNADFKPDGGCGAIIFKNTGDQVAKINDVWELQPGDETPTISTGHPDVIDVTQYSVAFDASSGSNASVTAIYTQTVPITVKNGAAVCDKF
jgi:hypothetical protein